jgi:flavorubredoxin
MSTTTTTTTGTPPASTAPRHLPVCVAPETWVIQDTQGEGVAPVAVHLNAMVITGPEPIVVDTGAAPNRDRYLEDLFGIVDPADVRWVFLTHDDNDHHGNLLDVLHACPNATLLTSWFQWERLGNLPGVAPTRMRWLTEGERFEANGGSYVALRPPIYDSPTTRGLLDVRTGVYWAGDCFASPVPAGMPDVADLEPDAWRGGFQMFQQLLAPWLDVADPAKYHATVDAFAQLGVRTIASAHSPSITGRNVDRAIAMLHDVLDAPRSPEPGQPVLDGIIAAMTNGMPA